MHYGERRGGPDLLAIWIGLTDKNVQDLNTNL